MLKFEKHSKDIRIRVQERKRVSKELAWGFGIAFFLHLGFFLMIQIKLLLFSEPADVHLKAPIQGEFFSLNPVQTHSKMAEALQTFPPPPSFTPVLTRVSLSPFEQTERLAVSPHPLDTYFQALPHLNKGLSLKGPMKARLQTLPPFSFPASFHVSLNIRIDDQTGQIIWYQEREKIADLNLKKALDTFLQSLRFTPQTGVISSSLLEVAYAHD